MTLKKTFSTLLLAAILCAPFTVSAQVTIGSDRAPSPWSLLDLCTREQQRALHNARMNTEQRDSLMNEDWLPAAERIEAQGLMIFNIDNECVEFWSGTAWISLCEGDEPPFITPPHWNEACRTEPACLALRRFNSTVRRLADVTNPVSDWVSNPDQNARTFTIPNTTVSFNMMPVTGGVFYMGDQDTSNDIPNRDPSSQGASISGSVHQVGVSSFYMMQTQVTRALWRAVLSASGIFTVGSETHTLTAVALPEQPNNPTPNPILDGDVAMNRVSWFDAVVFANRLSVILGRTPIYRIDGAVILDTFPNAGVVTAVTGNGFRLPTEAEWEYAARGGQRNEYTRTLGASGTIQQFHWSGSHSVNGVAWYYNQPLSMGGVHSVGQLQANQLGIFDMSGNVWEWCWDWWVIPYYTSCCAENPVGPPSGSLRIFRGGSWSSNAATTRVSNRHGAAPGGRGSANGVRLVFSAIE